MFVWMSPFACMNVWTYVRLFVLSNIFVCPRVFSFQYACMFVLMPPCAYMNARIFSFICCLYNILNIHLLVWMYLFMYVRVFVCSHMFVCPYLLVWIWMFPFACINVCPRVCSFECVCVCIYIDVCPQFCLFESCGMFVCLCACVNFMMYFPMIVCKPVEKMTLLCKKIIFILLLL